MIGRALAALLMTLGLGALLSAAAVEGLPHDPVLGPTDLCLPALLLAIITEGAVLLLLARIRKRPARRLLLAGGLVNVITVTALALVTGLGSASIATLVIAEIVIWLFEAAFLVLYPGTEVSWQEGLVFSLFMNLTSLLAGWAIVLSA